MPDGKPRGRAPVYAFFVKACREEEKKKCPTRRINFIDFSRQCSSKWRLLNGPDKKIYYDLAKKDAIRYKREMIDYIPSVVRGKRKRKDPNAPKRPLSSFFLFSNDERDKVKMHHPNYSVTQVAKELGKRWAGASSSVVSKYEQLAESERNRYRQEMQNYLQTARSNLS